MFVLWDAHAQKLNPFPQYFPNTAHKYIYSNKIFNIRKFVRSSASSNSSWIVPHNPSVSYYFTTTPNNHTQISHSPLTKMNTWCDNPRIKESHWLKHQISPPVYIYIYIFYLTTGNFKQLTVNQNISKVKTWKTLIHNCLSLTFKMLNGTS